MNKKNFLNEHWLPVVGYEELYEVSDYGRIRNLNFRGTGRAVIMNIHAMRGHYKIVALMKDGVKRQHRVHRLVAAAFLPVDERKFVQHINGDIQDNRACNLYWADTIERRKVSEAARLLISWALRYPSEERRQRMSEGQKRRFERERREKLGRYASQKFA